MAGGHLDHTGTFGNYFVSVGVGEGVWGIIFGG